MSELASWHERLEDGRLCAHRGEALTRILGRTHPAGNAAITGTGFGFSPGMGTTAYTTNTTFPPRSVMERR
jgi:hypothetical protein